MKATEILKADHQTVIELTDQLKGVGKRNAILLQRIYDSFKVHTQCEEQIFYPAMKEIGYTEVQQSVVEHKEMDHLLEEVMALPIQEEADFFFDGLNKFEQLIQEHIQEEEELLFSAAEDQLRDTLEVLGNQIDQLKLNLRSRQYGMAA
jgi:hemerythrin-like domain-containing protein